MARIGECLYVCTCTYVLVVVVAVVVMVWWSLRWDPDHATKRHFVIITYNQVFGQVNTELLLVFFCPRVTP